ncbi:MAG: twin-arginine translocase TatA/TatE family subunit [Nitrospira sp.]|nr:twin-arginine translocase TatA/TatE family subunit [Nitrospira sp.]
MFGIGAPELIVILVLALIIIGPKDLPRIGREVGKAYRNFKHAADEIKDSITREIEEAGKEDDHASKKEDREQKE